MLQRRSVWGAYASRVWCSASRRTEFSGGTPEIARGDACAPRTYPYDAAPRALNSDLPQVEQTRQDLPPPSDLFGDLF
jgi:hypothetical protein